MVPAVDAHGDGRRVNHGEVIETLGLVAVDGVDERHCVDAKRLRPREMQQFTLDLLMF